MYKAILWDNDGVLVDTETMYFEASRDVLASIGIELTHHQFIDISLRNGQSLFDLAIEQSDEETRALRMKRDEAYHRLLTKGVRVMDRVEATLQFFHGHIPMSIVTSSKREYFEVIHAQTGLWKYFDFSIALEDVKHTKPHPEPYLKAVERYGLRPSECLVVEDTERGLVSARQAGIDCVVIPNGYTEGGHFEGALRVLNNVGELKGLIRALEAGTPSIKRKRGQVHFH